MGLARGLALGHTLGAGPILVARGASTQHCACRCSGPCVLDLALDSATGCGISPA
jgi:hypothetical protein